MMRGAAFPPRSRAPSLPRARARTPLPTLPAPNPSLTRLDAFSASAADASCSTKELISELVRSRQISLGSSYSGYGGYNNGQGPLHILPPEEETGGRGDRDGDGSRSGRGGGGIGLLRGHGLLLEEQEQQGAPLSFASI